MRQVVTHHENEHDEMVEEEHHLPSKCVRCVREEVGEGRKKVSRPLSPPFPCGNVMGQTVELRQGIPKT